MALTVSILMLLAIAAPASGGGTGEPEGVAVAANVTYLTACPLAFYNTIVGKECPMLSFNLSNAGSSPRSIRAFSEYQGLSYRSVNTGTVSPGSSTLVNQTPSLLRNRTANISTITTVNLHYGVEVYDGTGWRLLEEQTVPVDVFPEDIMIWEAMDSEGNRVPLYEFVGVFVTPNSPAVRELLATAGRYADPAYDSRYSTYLLEHSLEGYQYPGDSIYEYRNYTALQVKAVYNALKYGYNITYINTATAVGGPDGYYLQRINPPEESIRLETANCADGAVLIASALEAVGIRPYIVTFPDHVFVAWGTDDTGKYIDALETTMLGTSDFEDAYAVGNAELLEYWELINNSEFEDDYLIVDIGEVRELGVLPMR
ncbi:hypothetical protein [Methanoculleus taiwanensis]|uniref:hypothetical protein n=1 Tax=Methanoculleus taiwanensis TaxID=1550565 RepID=UPI000FFF382C|nr:hypothetical protein [Methanoculleus taiwanensis]